MMKNLIQLLFSAIISVCLFACNSEQSRWDKAISANDIDEYKNFIDDYPNSNHTPTAKMKIKEIEYGLYHDQVVKKYIKEFKVDTVNGKTSVFLSEYWTDDGGLGFVSIPLIEENEKCFIYYVGPSTNFRNIRASSDGVYYPSDQMCKFVGYSFDVDNLPSKDMIKSAKDSLRAEFYAQMTNISKAIKPRELYYVYNDPSKYKDSLNISNLSLLYDFKKIGLEMELFQALILFNENKSGKCSFFIPKL